MKSLNFNRLGGISARRRYARIVLTSRSRKLVRSLYRHMELVIAGWLLLFGITAALRFASAPVPVDGVIAFVQIFLPYALAALAPIAGYRLAIAVFHSGYTPARTSFRFARLGRWRQVDHLTARSHPRFGPFGFMASLLIGMLLNIPVRSFEFLLAVPAMNGNAPAWGVAIFQLMAADVIVMNFLYAVVFVMALRSVPLFPRMLVFAWIMDLMLQLAIVRYVAGYADLPPPVATAMEDLLTGNVHKVLISIAVWLPYLLLSRRVNVTYRNRVPHK